MMKLWSFRRPTDEQVRAFYKQQAELPVTFYDSTSLEEQPPEGYYLDDNRVLLGHGQQTFQLACDALRRWKMYPQGWLDLIPPQPIMQEGTVVVVIARSLGLYWKNACRIVATYDDRNFGLIAKASPGIQSFGFIYVTLPGHVECGQERFRVVRDAEDQVWFEIRAFSKPHYWLARLAKPLVRKVQNRFFKESMAQMLSVLREAEKKLASEANPENLSSESASMPSNLRKPEKAGNGK